MTELIVGGTIVLALALLIVFRRKIIPFGKKEEKSKQAEAELHQNIRASARKVDWQKEWPNPVLVWKLFQKLPERHRGSPAILREAIISEFRISRLEANKVLPVFRRMGAILPESKKVKGKVG